MTATKRVIVPSVIDFDTTSARLAYAFVAADVGCMANDHENGNTYLVKAAGTGASCMRNLTQQDMWEFPIELPELREITSGSDVGDIAANAGLLASDTTPILRADTNESWEISWAAGNVDEVGCVKSLPLDASGNSLVDGTRDMYLALGVYSGSSDPATFAVGTSWDGGSQVSDSATDAAKSASRHTIICTIASGDIPDSPKTVSIELTPGTHDTNAIQLVSARLLAYRK